MVLRVGCLGFVLALCGKKTSVLRLAGTDVDRFSKDFFAIFRLAISHWTSCLEDLMRGDSMGTVLLIIPLRDRVFEGVVSLDLCCGTLMGWMV